MGETLAVIGSVLAAGPFVIVLLLLGIVPSPGGGQQAWFWAGITVFYYGLPAVVMWLLAWRKPEGFPAAVGLRRTRATWVVGGSLAGLFLVTVFNTVYTGLMTLVGLGPPEALMRIMEELVTSVEGGAFETMVTLLLVVVVAPVVEEAVFRGVALSGLTARIGPVAAITVTSLLFAAVHLDVWRAVPLAFMGAVLGYLTWRSRSIWPAVLAHAYVNAFAYLIALTLASR